MKKNKLIIIITIIAILLIFFYLLYKQYYIPLSVFVIILICISERLYKAYVIKLWRKVISIIIIVLLITLIIPFLINECYKVNNGYITLWSAADTLLFYGSFLSFISTMILGLIVFYNEKVKIENEAKINGKILLNILNNIEIQLTKIEPNNNMYIISYDHEWKKYLYSITNIKILYFEQVIETLMNKFEYIEKINYEISCNEFDKAISIHKNYIKNQKYKLDGFNDYEVYIYLNSLIYGYFTNNIVPLQFDLELQKKILSLSNKYFILIENWVYGRILRSLTHRIEFFEIDEEIVDWLISNSEIEELCKKTRGERIALNIAFKTSLEFGIKSKKINFCWNTYYLK